MVASQSLVLVGLLESFIVLLESYNTGSQRGEIGFLGSFRLNELNF